MFMHFPEEAAAIQLFWVTVIQGKLCLDSAGIENLLIDLCVALEK